MRNSCENCKYYYINEDTKCPCKGCKFGDKFEENEVGIDYLIELEEY